MVTVVTVRCRLDLVVSLDSAGKSGGFFSKSSERRYLITSEKMTTKQVLKTQSEIALLQKSIAQRFPFIVLPPLREPYLTEVLNEIADNPFLRCDAAFEQFLSQNGDMRNLPTEQSEGQLRWRQAITLRSQDNHRATISFMNSLRAEIDAAITSMKKLLKALVNYQQKLEALASAGLELSSALSKRLEYEEAGREKALASVPFDKMVSILEATTKSMRSHNENMQEASAARFHSHVVVPMEYDIAVLTAWRTHMDVMRKKFRLFAKLGEKISKEKDAAKIERMEREREAIEKALYQYEEGTLGLELQRLRNQRCERFQEWQHSIAEFHLELSSGLSDAWQFLQPKMDLQAPTTAPKGVSLESHSIPPGIPPGTSAVSSGGRKPQVRYHFSLSAGELRKRKPVMSEDFQQYSLSEGSAAPLQGKENRRQQGKEGKAESLAAQQILGTPPPGLHRKRSNNMMQKESRGRSPRQLPPKSPSTSKLRMMESAGRSQVVKEKRRREEAESEEDEEEDTEEDDDDDDDSLDINDALQPTYSSRSPAPRPKMGAAKKPTGRNPPQRGRTGNQRRAQRKPPNDTQRSVKQTSGSPARKPKSNATVAGPPKPMNLLSAIEGFKKEGLQKVDVEKLEEEKQEQAAMPPQNRPGAPLSPMNELRAKLAKRKETHKDGSRL